MSAPRFTLMAVLAHPDDESFGTSGTLAHHGADPDARVARVCAMRGEAGEISPSPGAAAHEPLGQMPPDIPGELQAWECFQLAVGYVGDDQSGHDLVAALR